jgi:arginase
MGKAFPSAAKACVAALLFQALAITTAAAAVPVGVVINPYAGDRAGPEKDMDAEAMAEGLEAVVAAAGGTIVSQRTVALTSADEAQYGRWNRFGLANGHLARMAGENQAAGLLNLGLYNNCSSLMGMLGGLTHAAEPAERVGLVWIDAHGDYNTPETTLSGMLGGMPVAIAAGDGLMRMRVQSGLLDPLPKNRIVMVGVRDTDPLEQARIERDRIPQITTADVRTLSDNLRQQMAALTEQSDIVYVHVDLDVLDPSEVSGHPLTVPDGPTGAELAEAIRVMFTYPKTTALGIASYPHTADPGGLTLKAVRSMVTGAIQGIQDR